MNSEPDWALWKSFEAVVRAGSLSAAARSLGISQPTVGRHIEELETALGVDLFERTLSGLRPNDAALRLYEPVAAAQRSFAEALMRARGAQPSLGGVVRVTASHMVSNYALPEILAKVRKAYPEIALELVPSDSTENLSLREADIAIRMFRPTQLELVSKKLGEIPIVAAAHRRYLEQRGTPESIADLANHDLLGFDRSDAILRAAKGMGFELRREDFVVRSDGQTLRSSGSEPISPPSRRASRAAHAAARDDSATRPRSNNQPRSSSGGIARPADRARGQRGASSSRRGTCA
jgi:DNA-binding transcriptional LysR family regulator